MKRVIPKLIILLFLVYCMSMIQNTNAQSNKKIIDIPYNNISNKQKLDIYFPKKVEKKMPVILYLHGGSYSAGDKSDNALENSDFYTNNNFIFVTINYRLKDEMKFPGAIDDVKTAIRFLKQNADKYSLDSENMFIIGHSAGANLASIVNSTQGMEALGDEKIEYSKYNSYVKGIVGISGFYDLNDYFYDKKVTNSKVAYKNILNYYGEEDYDRNKPFIKENNTIYIKNVKTPILLIHGDDDKVVSKNESKVYFENLKLRTNNKDVELYIINNMTHDYFKYIKTKQANILVEWLNKYISK